MKKQFLDLLARVTPSTVILRNCTELVEREQVGIKKYGVSLSDANLTHEQLLRHMLEEMLDCANYIQTALHTPAKEHIDYALLRQGLEQTIEDFDKLDGKDYPVDEDGEDGPERAAYLAGVSDAEEKLKHMLFRFDTAKIQRDLRK